MSLKMALKTWTLASSWCGTGRIGLWTRCTKAPMSTRTVGDGRLDGSDQEPDASD